MILAQITNGSSQVQVTLLARSNSRSLLGLALASSNAARESSKIASQRVPALVALSGAQAAAGSAFSGSSRSCKPDLSPCETAPRSDG